MTPAGIEPVPFRFVAQHLNHCATAVPSCTLSSNVNTPLPSNEISCVRLEDKLHSNYEFLISAISQGRVTSSCFCTGWILATEVPSLLLDELRLSIIEICSITSLSLPHKAI